MSADIPIRAAQSEDSSTYNKTLDWQTAFFKTPFTSLAHVHGTGSASGLLVSIFEFHGLKIRV